MMELTEKAIAAEIAIREAYPLNPENLNILANLYIVQDRKRNQSAPPLVSTPQYEQEYSLSKEPVTASEYGKSEFLKEVTGRNLKAVFGILDELMDTLRVVNTRAYENVMRQIKSI